MRRREREIIYYDDECNDDFAGVDRSRIEIDEHFPYLHKSRLWNAAAAVVYRGVMTPVAYLWCKLRFGLRVKNRRAIKLAERGQGCFLYGNHTLLAGDAFIPNLVTFPRRTFVVVGSENLSSRGTRNWIQMSGALPLPTKLSGLRAFLLAMETRVGQGSCICIYPEAHVWRYYTGIRPFGADSFRYPVRMGVPSFCTTVTYSKRRFLRTPRVTVYVDGPFYPDESLPARARAQALRDQIYQTMCRRAEESTYSPIQYVKRKERDDADPDPLRR